MRWVIEEKDIKRYPHFDDYITPSDLLDIVTSPDKVAANAFYPFLEYKDEWMPFGERATERSLKSRPIRYASRRDAGIFKYYRSILNEPYEKKLMQMGISSCPIAYRKIPISVDTDRGKCNIDFAYDVFEIVKEIENCCVVTLDISSYFECIDHQLLKQLWCQLLDVDRLAEDHYSVFKAVTKYSYVDRDSFYIAAGYDNSRKPDKSSHDRKKRMQICEPSVFRKLVRENPNLIKRNDKEWGIPQGSPISDLLANLYLVNFDETMNNFIKKSGGYYFRYSDDIVFVIPGGEDVGIETTEFARSSIKEFGSKLEIKKSKESVCCFNTSSDQELNYQYISGNIGKNGLEYLGFRFDGRSVYFRDSTLSRLHRKITFKARAKSINLVSRYQGKDFDFLLEMFNVPNFTQQYSRVKEFDETGGYKSWTFWSYVRRASNKFGKDRVSLFNQMKRHKQFIEGVVEKELRKALANQELKQS